MKHARIIITFSFLFILLLSACSLNITLPDAATPSAEQIMNINEAYPSASPAQLRIEMGAGDLSIQPGSNVLISGTIHYNVPEWGPTVERSGALIRLGQYNENLVTVPLSNTINDWELQLGSEPIELTINAGAYRGTLELGGLALISVDIQDGASQATVQFSEPNLMEMNNFQYSTGASQIELLHLANANFSSMDFEGGAGQYTLDFTGQLQRNANVTVRTGVSDMHIVVPQGMPVEVRVTGGLNNVGFEGLWTVANSTYATSGSCPGLTITVEMAVGSLTLVSQ